MSVHCKAALSLSRHYRFYLGKRFFLPYFYKFMLCAPASEQAATLTTESVIHHPASQASGLSVLLISGKSSRAMTWYCGIIS